MIPDFRFNKKITKYLLKSSVKDNGIITPLSLSWKLDNTDKIYGSVYKDLWGHNHSFIIQKFDENLYRIVYPDKHNQLHLYSIGDIEKYLKIIGVEEIIPVTGDSEEERIIFSSIKLTLEGLKTLPHSGIIEIEEERVYVYDFTNNE